MRRGRGLNGMHTRRGNTCARETHAPVTYVKHCSGPEQPASGPARRRAGLPPVAPARTGRGNHHAPLSGLCFAHQQFNVPRGFIAAGERRQRAFCLHKGPLRERWQRAICRRISRGGPSGFISPEPTAHTSSARSPSRRLVGSRGAQRAARGRGGNSAPSGRQLSASARGVGQHAALNMG